MRPRWDRKRGRLLVWMTVVTAASMVLMVAVMADAQSPAPPTEEEPGTVLDPPARLGTPEECASGDSRTPRRDRADNEVLCPDEDPDQAVPERRPDPGALPLPPPLGFPPDSTVPGGPIPPSPSTSGPLPGGPIPPPLPPIPGEPQTPVPGP